MADSARVDPFKNFNFLVEIDGIAQAGFSECTGLRLEVDVIEYREGADLSSVRKLPGRSRVGDITLKRGITTSNELQAWFESTLNGLPSAKTASSSCWTTREIRSSGGSSSTPFRENGKGPILTQKGPMWRLKR